MANINDIQGFIVSGLPAAPASWVGTFIDPRATLGQYDFLDANNDNRLNRTAQTGDQIRVDDANPGVPPEPAPTNVTGLASVTIRLHFTDNTFYDVPVVTGAGAKGFRAYQLADGRTVIRPFDNSLNDPLLRTFSEWQSLEIRAAAAFPTLAGTTIPDQDDPFPFIPCFTADTRILTAEGERPAGALAVGDLVMTADHGLQPIRWIGQVHVDAARIAADPRLAPVVIAPSALAPGLPSRPLTLSRQHRVLMRNAVAQRMSGASEVLCSAKSLTTRDGVATITPPEGVTYIHLLFDTHEIIFAEAAPCESLYLGPVVTAGLSAAAHEEISALFPDLAGDLSAHSEPARPLLSGPKVERMIERLASRPLVELEAPAHSELLQTGS